MFTPANTSDTENIDSAAPAHRNRFVSSVVTLAVALAVVAAPQLTDAASATGGRSTQRATKMSVSPGCVPLRLEAKARWVPSGENTGKPSNSLV